MILDSSALVAVLKNEPESSGIQVALLEAERLSISAATLFETWIVVDSYRNPILRARLDALIERFSVAVEPFSLEQARVAREAYRDYGRGSAHRANLNMGDCYAYALARVRQEPLLCKGDDFCHTDLSLVHFDGGNK